MMTNPGNRLTQGQFSFMPDLTDKEITAQIKYALSNGWAVNVEYTDDPHPRNTYWEMFGLVMFDLKDPAGILMEVNNCRKTFPSCYIRINAFDNSRGVESPRMSRINAFDNSRGVESPRMSYLVNRPKKEPGFRLTRQEGPGRSVHYTVHSYAADRPEGERYT